MNQGWKLPEKNREAFKRRIGVPVKESELAEYHDKKTIAVGDVVSLTLRENGIVPLLSVYDGMTERHEVTGFASLVERQGWRETVVANPAGMITRGMDDAVRNALTGTSEIIRVEGEEDLALLPCILHAPNGTVVFYGWPGEGMMAVTTDDSIRKEIRELWETMEVLE